MQTITLPIQLTVTGNAWKGGGEGFWEGGEFIDVTT
jgi:hypothetical protein